MKLACSLLLLLAAPAAADPARHTLGWDYRMGSYPRGDPHGNFAGMLGLHGGGFGPGATRVEAEYDWMTVGDGHGHRLGAFVHRPFWTRALRNGDLAFEAELGAGAALIDRTVHGDAFVGLRFSSYAPTKVPSPSTQWDAYLALRAIGTADGVGVIFSMGTTWGD